MIILIIRSNWGQGVKPTTLVSRGPNFLAPADRLELGLLRQIFNISLKQVNKHLLSQLGWKWNVLYPARSPEQSLWKSHSEWYKWWPATPPSVATCSQVCVTFELLRNVARHTSTQSKICSSLATSTRRSLSSCRLISSGDKILLGRAASGLELSDWRNWSFCWCEDDRTVMW